MKSICFIPVYNQIKEFPTVLKELKNSNLPVDEILLINNGSNDGSESWFMRVATLTSMFQKTKGSVTVLC